MSRESWSWFLAILFVLFIVYSCVPMNDDADLWWENKYFWVEPVAGDTDD